VENKEMHSCLWEKGLVFVILLVLLWTPFLITTNASVVPGLYPDALPLIPSDAPADCGYEDLENGIDGQQIISSLSGLTFTTTSGYLWIYGDVRTGKYNLKYPSGAYTCQGNIFAWLGPEQSSGRIDFTKGDASYFSCYVSTYSGAVIDAYKDDGTFLCSSGWAENNLNTGRMTLLSVYRPDHDIGYVIIHDAGNYWCIDRIVCDAPNVGTSQHPVPKVVVDSEYQGNNIYKINVKLMNIGEESLNDPPSHPHGIHAQIIGGEIQTSNKGTFASCLEFHGYSRFGLTTYQALEFYVDYLDHNGECSGSFAIKTKQGNKANIGIRAWIFDKDNTDNIYNPNTGQYEPYIARCPTEDLSSENNRPYNQHLNDPHFSAREYKLNYYPLYQSNDFNTNHHSIWLGLEYTFYHSSEDVKGLLDNLRIHSIHEIYLDIGGASADGSFRSKAIDDGELTEEEIKANCGIFMDAANWYASDNGYDFTVYAWINGAPFSEDGPYYQYDVRIPSVRTNIAQFCQEFVGDDVKFDGIHYDYEFWDTAYEDAYLTLLSEIEDTMPSTKFLSVDITSAWLDSGEYVHDIAEISDEIVLMAYTSSREYEAYAEWVMDRTDMMFDQAEETASQVIIGVSRSRYFDDKYVFKGERLDYGLVGVLMGARKNGRTQVNIAIWNEWERPDLAPEDWRIFDAIWNPVRTVDVYVFSPVDLHLYDSLGRHVGLDYAHGGIDNEIPGSYYSGPNAEPQRITIINPTDDEYTIVLLGTKQGTYQLKIEGYISGTLVHSEVIDGNTNEGETHTFCVTIPVEKPFGLIVGVDSSPPSSNLAIGDPKYIDPSDNVYVTSDSPFALSAEDNPGGVGVSSTFYCVYNSSYNTGWLEYSAPFYLIGLTDGEYSIDYYSTDNLGNTEPTNTVTVILDNTPPSTTLTIGEPKYISDKTYVTPDTPFNLEATDIGSGVHSTAYRIFNATYDSGWITYIVPFHLTSLTDGAYTIEYNSTDNVQNIETTHAINATLFSWNYIYQDTYGRGTTLKINLAHKFFQFIRPDKDYGIRKATYMKQCGRAIIISHCDKELRLITVAVDTKLDFCYAIASDLHTRKRYLLIDKVGIE